MVIKIECDRRIKKLNIEFTDEDYNEDETTVEFSKNSDIPKSKKQAPVRKLLNLDEPEAQEIVQEVVEKPKIEEVERPVLVSEDMQNLSF